MSLQEYAKDSSIGHCIATVREEKASAQESEVNGTETLSSVGVEEFGESRALATSTSLHEDTSTSSTSLINAIDLRAPSKVVIVLAAHQRAGSTSPSLSLVV